MSETSPTNPQHHVLQARGTKSRTARWIVGSLCASIGAGLVAVAFSHFRPANLHIKDVDSVGVNQAEMPGDAPAGMAWIPGGTFWMGCEEFPDARPVHKVSVDGFWMDITEVTNAQFRRFVEETNYVTTAEKPPDLGDIMHLLQPGEKPPTKGTLAPGSFVFSATARPVKLDDYTQWWKRIPGADWRHPEGPERVIKDREQHPAVHVSYYDALAYCAWRSKKEGGVFRLPTEAEWEFAARGGLDRQAFVWGDTFAPKLANTWQGEFPHRNTMEDGFLTTAPVASFPANGFGLFDMAGNVWEWCADWYVADYYSTSPSRNPPGPPHSHDPDEPGVPKRAQRGGSFLCCDEYCKRYMPGARGKGEPYASANHIGFRCVRSVP